MHKKPSLLEADATVNVGILSHILYSYMGIIARHIPLHLCENSDYFWDSVEGGDFSDLESFDKFR